MTQKNLDLLELIRRKETIDEKFEMLATLLQTQAVATQNVQFAILSAISRTPELNKARLIEDLDRLKEIPPDDLNERAYKDFIGLCIRRLQQPVER